MARRWNGGWITTALSESSDASCRNSQLNVQSRKFSHFYCKIIVTRRRALAHTAQYDDGRAVNSNINIRSATMLIINVSIWPICAVTRAVELSKLQSIKCVA